MADKTAEVVRYLRRKSNGGFNEPITYLGTEERFVSPLKNSNLNNLEEQYLMGTDTHIEKYVDEEGNGIIERSFRASGNLNEYYKLNTIIYKVGLENEDFFFDDRQLKLPNDDSLVLFGDGSEEFAYKESLYGIDYDAFKIVDGEFRIVPTTNTQIRKDTLYYVKEGQPDTLVLEKTTNKQFVDGGSREIIKESIVNHLA